jgi:hypothetical protein
MSTPNDPQTRAPKPHTLADLPASSHVSPAFLQWAAEQESVRPGEDGTLPAMDRGGFGIQSLVWGGPLQTGEASVLENQDQRGRRDLAKVMAMKEMGHGEASVVGGSSRTTGAEEVKERPRERKRDLFRKLFGDDAQKRRFAREMGA